MLKKILTVVLAVAILIGLTYVNAVMINTKQFSLREEALSSEKIDDDTDGLLIAFFSDLDYGHFIDRTSLDMIIEKIALFQPDIILLHCPNPFLYPIISKLSPPEAKFVLLWHSDILGKGALYHLVSHFEKRILEKADLIMATSPNYIHPSSPIYAYRHKTKVIPNGIIKSDFQWKLGDETTVEDIRRMYNHKKIIFFVGRHATYKGINYLIEAERYIKSDCVILIGGRGPETEKLKKSTKSERIKFVGRIPNEYLKCYYYASDIFAFTSCTKQEAFGIALAEAMYCGSVPVTFTIEGSGVNWVSINGQTGEEVPLGDVKAYAAAIDKLIKKKELYYKYASAGKERIVDMFTSERANNEAERVLLGFFPEKTSGKKSNKRNIV